MREAWRPEGDAPREFGGYEHERRGPTSVEIHWEPKLLGVTLYDANGDALAEPPRPVGFRAKK